ncbi:hypothetical protein [Sphingomonas alba]|uniref:Secreted protein n=1 Tax=Sphingomonas alba TaxID=2908208 RepID=A0ABT0RQ75_9SPHN|nr:hypothetical protein [Sphingomonas alba]MCL6684783.1 hypothetical protein [Sphingomonas alba]
MLAKFSRAQKQAAALILMAGGVAAIGSGAAQAVPRPATCPSSGNSKAPFYGVAAAQIGQGKPVHVSGNYRLTDRNRKLVLTETGESKTLLRLKLSSSRSAGLAAGCPHFGGEFNAAATVKQVRITDWKKQTITVRVGRPRPGVSAARDKTL